MENLDYQIDDLLKSCITKDNRKSFFLYAGAGSGKTESLVRLLKHINEIWGQEFKVRGQKVAVITFTNAATDEINRRVDYNPLFAISTLHSFCWTLVSLFQKDIKASYLQRIESKLEQAILKKENTKRPNQKMITDIEIQSEKVEKAKYITHFVYNPNGSNLEKNSLSHQEVIEITSELIRNKPLLQTILVQQFPIILIDESQDTKAPLLEALLKVQENHPKDFILGLIGDTKQRIYMDGIAGLENLSLEGWEKPFKHMNYRSDKRIVELANKLSERLQENASQVPLSFKEDGTVRFYIVDSSNPDLNKEDIEKRIREDMSNQANDVKWKGDVKILTLEHDMAAVRLGFSEFYNSLKKYKKYQMSLNSGDITELEFFKTIILPLEAAMKQNQRVKVANIVKKHSPIVKESIKGDYLESLKACNSILKEIKGLLDDEGTTIEGILRTIKKTDLFQLPDSFRLIFEKPELTEEGDSKYHVWNEAIKSKYVQLKEYLRYVQDLTQYATHQGVKGLQFDRVMCLIDDKEAKGFLFSYEKLFEVNPLSETDKKNMAEGKETVLDRTLRLFYVICTRAMHSLAIVFYTTEVERLKETAISKGWFKEDEVIIFS
ncbi:MAG: UvrD-helicase domain-containing protein [Bacteroidales bacterium]|nr:UvrD-helicase domain-containing protein [Bacteroidales bacterium]